MQRYLYGSLSDLYDPHLLKDADKGAEIIKEKIDSVKKGKQATYIEISKGKESNCLNCLNCRKYKNNVDNSNALVVY